MGTVDRPSFEDFQAKSQADIQEKIQTLVSEALSQQLQARSAKISITSNAASPKDDVDKRVKELKELIATLERSRDAQKMELDNLDKKTIKSEQDTRGNSSRKLLKSRRKLTCYRCLNGSPPTSPSSLRVQLMIQP